MYLQESAGCHWFTLAFLMSMIDMPNTARAMLSRDAVSCVVVYSSSASWYSSGISSRSLRLYPSGRRGWSRSTDLL